MKPKYITPRIFVEALERADVLLSSVTDPTDSQRKFEKENRYSDFLSFVGDPKKWFDD